MSSNVGGHRFVLGLYATLVAVAGITGCPTGTFVSSLGASRFLFLVSFPPTPAGLMTCDALAIALILGVPLALVVYASVGLDDAAQFSIVIRHKY